MRPFLVLLPLIAAASPAAAQQPAPGTPPVSSLPPEITDPRMLDRLGEMTGVLAKALMNMPVGELEAAIENRPVTKEDRRRTVGSEMGADARNIDRDVERGKVAMKQGGQALQRALPAITRALASAGEELEKAVANVPSPTYPKR